MKQPSLLNDILFKIVFGSESSEPVLRALLNALLHLEGEQRILELVILNPNIDKEYLSEKGPILDVKARDEAGRQYNIEVQLNPGLGEYIARSVYYTTKFFCEQLQRGDDYNSLRRTVSISLLDFVLFPETQELQSRFSLLEFKQLFPLTDLLELHYIEFPKFQADKPRNLKTRFERWLHVLKFSDLYDQYHDLPEVLAQEEGISMAIDSMRKAYAKDEYRELIEAREKAERDRVSGLSQARREGMEIGEKRGEKREKLSLATRLLQDGFDKEKVSLLTGLSLEEVEQLKA